MSNTIGKVKMLLQKHGKKGIRASELAKLSKAKTKKEFAGILNTLEQQGLFFRKNGKLYSAKALGLVFAEVSRVNKTFGFAKTNEKEETEYFIPGRYLKGAMPGDKVLLKRIRGNGSSPEAEVYAVTKYGSGEFTGKLFREGNGYFIEPDGVVRYPVPVDGEALADAGEGDKVLAKIVKRGRRHSEHMAAVVSAYGNADSAYACSNAILSLARVEKSFPQEVERAAKTAEKNGIAEKDNQHRIDLRNEIIFTIDGADAMDLDDAVSLEQYDDCYILGVHIADVSHYVNYQSELDKEAYRRGTSIYYADQVIPMLPKALSNGICSLHPGVDRLTLSALLTLDLNGHLVDFDFQKTVIHSKVKGVYDEVNLIFAGQETPDITRKYQPVRDKLLLMKELADILSANKRRRGAPEIETRESKVITGENHQAVDVQQRTSGAAQQLIEEFMLIANEAAAMAGKMKHLPILYRIHEQPSEEKLENLNRTLKLLGVSGRGFTANVKPKAFADILDKVKGQDIAPIVNLQVLRSMSKAKYSELPVGHYGLALENYAHFTSPIRRYPDLVVHRMISALLERQNLPEIQKKYRRYTEKAGKQSTQMEMLAMKIERDCEDCYKAEYMRAHLGEEFDGIIASAANHGIYVALSNTIEGLVRVESLPEGSYEFDGVMEYRETLSGKRYRVGQKVRVQCAAADVNSGNIDFVLV